jgi:hypothetical protein
MTDEDRFNANLIATMRKHKIRPEIAIPFMGDVVSVVFFTLEKWARSNETIYDEYTLIDMLRSSPIAPPKEEMLS